MPWDKQVDIGLPTECEPWQVESRLFPSKIGGKPAWLDLENIPTTADLQCNVCEGQMIFLCQVYAPFEEDNANFHRSLFVFTCRKTSCCKKNNSEHLKVFRSHLCRYNDFYPEIPPRSRPDPNFKLSDWVKLCILCGCFGEKHCSKCREVYCCRDHQVLDWKETHKRCCGSSNRPARLSRHLFMEFEITIEPEIDDDSEIDEEEEMDKFKKLREEGKTGTMPDASEEDLQAHASMDHDKAFSHFKKRIGQDPEQVLRYERGGNPLWVAEAPRPDSVPNCEYCGGERQFEFQIMPQMLAILNETALDWGVLLVYTCKYSCVAENGYKREFIFKQDISEKN